MILMSNLNGIEGDANRDPRKYWRNLPEASLIKPLIAGAGHAASAMIADAATDPHKAQKSRSHQ